jgi:hypothetical protein
MTQKTSDPPPAWWSELTIDDASGAADELEAMLSGKREMDVPRACRLWHLLLALGETEELRRILEIIETQARVSGADAPETEAWLDRQWPLVQELAALEEPLTSRYPDYATLASRIREIENTMQSSAAAIRRSRMKKSSFPLRLKGRQP